MELNLGPTKFISYEKNIWFIVSAIVLCVFAVILIANSSDSPEKISSRQIVKSYNQFLDDNALSQKFTTIDIGYYETTFEERCNLKKMEAVGLITVEFEELERQMDELEGELDD